MPTKKTPTRKLRSGKRTARTQGISQSAFAGYGTAQQPPPPKEKNEDLKKNEPKKAKDTSEQDPPP